jgi:hypothetical protein
MEIVRTRLNCRLSTNEEGAKHQSSSRKSTARGGRSRVSTTFHIIAHADVPMPFKAAHLNQEQSA